jgi:hypothetical protein
MFRVSFICDDKKLHVALRSLVGMAVGAPEAVPVVNAVKRNGKAQPAGSGDTAEMFAKYAKEKRLIKFKANELREFCKTIGVSPTSYSYFAQQLRKAGKIKKHGNGSASHYTVVAS